MDPPPGEVADAGTGLVSAGEHPLKGVHHASVADAEHGSAGMGQRDAVHGVEEPGGEAVAALPAGGGRETPLEPGVQGTGPLLFDLGPGQARPLADVVLLQAGLDLDRQVHPLGQQLGGPRRAPHPRVHDGGEPQVAQRRPGLP